MATDRRATTVWKGTLFEGEGTFTVESGVLGEHPVSWPARTGKDASKTSPEELLAAAHSACLSMQLSNLLAKNDTPADTLTVTATATFDKIDGGFGITKVHLDVEGVVPGIDESRFAEKVDAAKDGCPVSNALKGNVDVSVASTLA